MKTDVILAGFGGQGMLLIGKILSLAAMQEGKEVCWLPSYGPEMRGGTANVTVTISDEPIGSPVVSTPQATAVMNQPSLEKFGPALVPGGLLIINESLVKVRFDRDDIEIMYLPANDLANSIGAKRSPNIVVLGAYAALSEVVSLDSIGEQIRAQFGRKPQVAELNLRAFQLGVDAATSYRKQGKAAPTRKRPAARAARATPGPGRKPAAKAVATKRPAKRSAAKAAAKKPAVKKRTSRRATKKTNKPAAKKPTARKTTQKATKRAAKSA